MAAPRQDQYLKTQIETASKEQLVIMLFDGVLRFTEQARAAIDKKEAENSHHLLMRAQAIIMELIYTLDKEKGGDVAKNLLGLYAYSFNCLIQANVQKNTAMIDEVQKVFRGLREGWAGAMGSLGLSAADRQPAADPKAGTDAPAPAKPAYGGTVPPRIAAQPAVRPAAPPPAKGITGYGMGRTASIAAAGTARQPAAALAGPPRSLVANPYVAKK